MLEVAEQQRNAVHLAEQQLETRRATIEQMCEELALTQRDVLQERLAVEEATAELLSHAPAAKVNDILFRGRTKIGEYYRLQIEQLAEERRHLETILEQLPDEQQKLRKRQQEIEEWLHDRQLELTTMATKMAEKEKELDRRGELFAKLQHDWTRERADYQRELRRLLSELGR
jgi:hypothetical protein